MKPNKVKIQYDSVFNNDGILKIVSEGNIDELGLTNQMKTMLNTNIENIRKASSEMFEDIKFDVRKGFDKNLFKKMIDEWSLTISNKYGIYNLNNIKIVEEGAECEICKSLNGNAKGRKNCKTLYRIHNNITDKTLWVGTICINKFDINVYHEGKRIKSKDVVKFLDKIGETAPNYNKDATSTVWEVANRSGIVALRDYIIENKDNMDKKKLNTLRGYLKIFSEDMIKLRNAMYTCYNNKNLPDFKLGEAYQEAMLIQSNLYKICREVCNEGCYIFAPSVDFSMNYMTKYSAFYILTTSYVMSRYYYNLRSDLPIFNNINVDLIREIRDQTKFTERVSAIKSEIRTYMNLNNKITKNHIMALIIMFGDKDEKEEELKTIFHLLGKENLEKFGSIFDDMRMDVPDYLIGEYEKVLNILDSERYKEKKTIKKAPHRKRANRSKYN